MKKLDKDFITLQNKIIRIEKMGQSTIAKNYKKVLDDLRVSMSKLYSNYEINGQLTYNEMVKFNRLQKLDKEVFEIITELYKSNSKAIKGTLEGVTKDTYKNTISIVNGAVEGKLKGIAKDINITKTINTDMAGLKWVDRMGKNRNDAIWNIQKEIKQGLKNGDTYGTMSKRLKDVLETDIKKANVIIRTESHRCMGQAKEDSFNEIAKAGVVFKEKWISSRDERTRSSHQSLNGTIIERGEMFYSDDGGVGPGPGLMEGSVSDNINCRCIKVLILED